MVCVGVGGCDEEVLVIGLCCGSFAHAHTYLVGIKYLNGDEWHTSMKERELISVKVVWHKWLYYYILKVSALFVKEIVKNMLLY